jgi:hypothetical protein
MTLSDTATENETIDVDAFRRGLQAFGRSRGEWGGIPMPVAGLDLVLEPSYPWRKLEEFKISRPGEEASDEARRIAELLADKAYEGWTVVNSWFCFQHDHYVIVLRRPDGKSVQRVIADRYAARYQHFFNGMSVAFEAHDAEAELTALEKLRTHIKPHLWHLYVLTGSFLETSSRSGIIYIFRKGRPTLAIRKKKDGMTRPFVAPASDRVLHEIVRRLHGAHG